MSDQEKGLLVLFSLISSEFEKIEEDMASLDEAVPLLNSNVIVSPGVRHVLLAGIASTIEKAYSGSENILKRVATDVDGYMPKGESWHKDLIEQMSICVDVRGAVLSTETVRQMHEMRMFRHRERNTYGFMLNEARVLDLAEGIRSMVHNLKTGMGNLHASLRSPASPDDDGAPTVSDACYAGAETSADQAHDAHTDDAGPK